MSYMESKKAEFIKTERMVVTRGLGQEAGRRGGMD